MVNLYNFNDYKKVEVTLIQVSNNIVVGLDTAYNRKTHIDKLTELDVIADIIYAYLVEIPIGKLDYYIKDDKSYDDCIIGCLGIDSANIVHNLKRLSLRLRNLR